MLQWPVTCVGSHLVYIPFRFVWIWAKFLLFLFLPDQAVLSVLPYGEQVPFGGAAKASRLSASPEPEQTELPLFLGSGLTSLPPPFPHLALQEAAQRSLSGRSGGFLCSLGHMFGVELRALHVEVGEASPPFLSRWGPAWICSIPCLC